MALRIFTWIAISMLYAAPAIAGSGHSSDASADDWDSFSDDSDSDATTEAGFNYSLALQELNEQVRQGKIPPEAVAQVLESIAPILARLDEQGEQIQDLSAKGSTDSVKLVVRTMRDEDEVATEKKLQNASAGGTSSSALPPIPKTDAAATTAANGTSASNPGLAISIGSGSSLPMLGQTTSLPQASWLKSDGAGAYNSPKKETTGRPIANAMGSGSAAGGGTNSNTTSGPGAADASASSGEGPWASLSQMMGSKKKVTTGAKALVNRKDGEVKRLVASAVTGFQKDSERGLASTGSSALQAPKLSKTSKLLQLPAEYVEPRSAQAGEVLTQRPDLLGWVFGTLITLLSIRAWFQWRRSRS